MTGAGRSGFVLFFGGGASSEIERRLDRLRLAIAEHVVGLARHAGFQPVVAVTSDDRAAHGLRAAGATVTRTTTRPFHYGRELRVVVRDHGMERVCAIGAGAGALLDAGHLTDLRTRLETAEMISVSNNYYSGDLIAFAPARALDSIELPATDNPLPRLLHQQAGLPRNELERSAATLFDVDTPTDATILVRHPRCPAPVRAIGGWEREQGARLSAVMRLLTTPEAEVCIAGRVGAPVWTYLETQTACRIRVLSEERGMQAAGRDRSGAARTALGFLYEEVGPTVFFERLAELAGGVIFDSRVLFAHLHLEPSPAERFASDVYAHEDIADERLAVFTRAASEAPIPVVLGGHSLVGGGLWALTEAAWQANAEPPAGRDQPPGREGRASTATVA
jgi:hypothetical protein